MQELISTQGPPSLLISLEPVALSPQFRSTKPRVEDELFGRLVDYSSSLDSDAENEENIEKSVAGLEQSPVPGPSGTCMPTTFSDSDSVSSRSLPIEDLFQHLRGVNAFNSYSDSDTENNGFKQKSEKTPVKNKTRSPDYSDDDDLPLADIQSKKSSTMTFKELIPTPNFAVIKHIHDAKLLTTKDRE